MAKLLFTGCEELFSQNCQVELRLAFTAVIIRTLTIIICLLEDEGLALQVLYALATLCILLHLEFFNSTHPTHKSPRKELKHYAFLRTK
jgi:bisphosphoglycerate-dependent phosphoglycerate mutase